MRVLAALIALAFLDLADRLVFHHEASTLMTKRIFLIGLSAAILGGTGAAFIAASILGGPL